MWMRDLERKFEKFDIGHVYVLEDIERSICKIGATRNCDDRTQRVLTEAGVIDHTSYISGRCINKYAAEKQVHKNFEKFRRKGEWFNIKKSEAVHYIENNIKIITSENEDYYNRKMDIQEKIKKCLHSYSFQGYYTKNEKIEIKEEIEKIFEESKREDWIFNETRI